MDRPTEYTLKVEAFSFSFAPARPIYPLIYLKGKWLAKTVTPNSRVVIEEGINYIILRRQT